LKTNENHSFQKDYKDITLTANPIVPSPKTATVDPCWTLQIFQADPTP